MGVIWDGDWKDKYRQQVSPEQLQAFEDTKPLHAFVSGHNKGNAE